MFAVILEKLHGEMEFVFGKGQSMPKSWKGTWGTFGAARSSVKAWPSEFATCVLFDIGPLECRIASLLHCINPHRTGITRHQKHLIDNTSNPNFYVRARANLSQVAQVPLYFAQTLPSLLKGIGYRKEEGQEIGTKSIENLQQKRNRNRKKVNKQIGQRGEKQAKGNATGFAQMDGKQPNLEWHAPRIL